MSPREDAITRAFIIVTAINECSINTRESEKIAF